MNICLRLQKINVTVKAFFLDKYDEYDQIGLENDWSCSLCTICPRFCGTKAISKLYLLIGKL